MLYKDKNKIAGHSSPRRYCYPTPMPLRVVTFLTPPGGINIWIEVCINENLNDHNSSLFPMSHSYSVDIILCDFINTDLNYNLVTL